jgi:lipoprotein-anchoring transpeptidase ErfK/SrfK
MARQLAALGALLAIVAGVVWGLSAISSGASTPETVTESGPAAPPEPRTEEERERAAAEHAAMLDREWPLHGVVTGTQLTVRAEASSEATVLGWLRVGGHVRLQREPTQAPGCRSGWYRIYPRGFACAGQGIDVSETPPTEEETSLGPNLSSHLPYRYLFVKEPQVPEWFQLPSREDQRAAEAHAQRYVQLLTEGNERLAARLRAGQLPNEPAPPREVSRFLDHGFFLASNGVEVRSRRRFVRTVRGTYVKEAQLEERTGSSFEGVELAPELGPGHQLPLAWAVRTARPLVREQRGDASRMADDESLEPFERLALVPWVRRERVGDQVYHVVTAPNGEERYLREWYLAVAERRDPPGGIAGDEPWVHVDLSSQTLVVYRGETPIFATIVSSGTEGHATPAGEYTIRRKLISDTMADPGSDLGDDRYRIEDVPWTQYFEGSIALHAAFWHSQYGIVRSHGCVNIAPRDAHYVFQHTWPEVPEGWHGVSTEGTGFRGSRVLVTE